ncbi:MAG: replication initiation protein [Proteobacteria bacterium]|nr:replication initiation protein [Pseudomonadota bacterium]
MRLLRGALIGAILLVGGWSTAVAWFGREAQGPSRCIGNPVSGHLVAGRRLPYSGVNFHAYSLFGYLIGRTFMHATVRDTIVDAYADLAREHQEYRFVYAESAWPFGGPFPPHKTHANGTAVDFLVPVRATRDGTIEEVSTAPWKLFGYGNDFDKSGVSGGQQIDFQAIGLHLLALDKAARARGISLRRVIMDVNLQPKLAATPAGREAHGRLAFNSNQAWVRHDEHYHVEFNVPCR